MKNTLNILIIIISVIIIIGGCTAKQSNDNSLIDYGTDLPDSLVNEKFEKSDVLTVVELKTLLETSGAIEVKNIENQIIGQISTGEKINKVIEDIFSYTVIDNYENSSDEDVVATINFFPNGEQPIYGLIKEKFIYIEGYYFTSNKNNIRKIVEYFQINTEEEPIVGD